MYKPFSKVQDVDPYFMHKIELGKEVVTIIGAEKTDRSLFILAIDSTGSEIYMSANTWFNIATYRGRPFGMSVDSAPRASYRYASNFPN